MTDQSLPYISIILPVKNEARFIASTLEQLARQDYPAHRFELVLVDGMSTDATVACAQAVGQDHPQIKLKILQNPKELSSSARNIGVANSEGDYILIVDGHVDITSRTLLTDAAALIARTGAQVLGRPQRLSATGLTKAQEIIAATRASRIGHAQDSHIYSNLEGWASPASMAVMYKKSLFERFGGFDEAFDAAEDLEFNTRLERAGLLAYTSPKLEVLYFPRASLSALLRQMRRYGTGRFRLWRKYRRWPSILAAAPALMVAGGVTLGLGCLAPALSAFCFVLLMLGAVLYSALVRIVYDKDQVLKRFPFFEVLKTMLVIHLGLGVGIWEGALRRGTPTKAAS